MTRVNKVVGRDGKLRLLVSIDAEDLKVMDTRMPDGDYEAVEVYPPKGKTFAEIAFVLPPATTPGVKPTPQPVIVPLASIVIGKLHVREIRKLREAEAVKEEQAKLEEKNQTDRKRAEKMKNLSPCCEAKMVRDGKDPDGVVTCTKCETKYKKVGSVWIEAETSSKSK